MEDTINKDDAMLEEMLRDVEEFASETKTGTVVHKGDEDVPAPVIISSIEGGGKVKVYDTKTGEMSWVLYNRDTGGMLRGALRQKNPDGTHRFQLKKPPFEPPKGTLRCYLHPDNPERELYNKMGLPVCRKSNITAPYMVEKHMKNRHPTAWAIIEKEKVDREKKEDREFNRSLISLASGKTVGTPEAPLYVSKKDKQK